MSAASHHSAARRKQRQEPLPYPGGLKAPAYLEASRSCSPAPSHSGSRKRVTFSITPSNSRDEEYRIEVETDPTPEQEPPRPVQRAAPAPAPSPPPPQAVYPVYQPYPSAIPVLFAAQPYVNPLNPPPKQQEPSQRAASPSPPPAPPKTSRPRSYYSASQPPSRLIHATEFLPPRRREEEQPRFTFRSWMHDRNPRAMGPQVYIPIGGTRSHARSQTRSGPHTVGSSQRSRYNSRERGLSPSQIEITSRNEPPRAADLFLHYSISSVMMLQEIPMVVVKNENDFDAELTRAEEADDRSFFCSNHKYFHGLEEQILSWLLFSVRVFRLKEPYTPHKCVEMSSTPAAISVTSQRVATSPPDACLGYIREQVVPLLDASDAAEQDLGNALAACQELHWSAFSFAPLRPAIPGPPVRQPPLQQRLSQPLLSPGVLLQRRPAAAEGGEARATPAIAIADMEDASTARPPLSATTPALNIIRRAVLVEAEQQRQATAAAGSRGVTLPLPFRPLTAWLPGGATPQPFPPAATRWSQDGFNGDTAAVDAMAPPLDAHIIALDPSAPYTNLRFLLHSPLPPGCVPRHVRTYLRGSLTAVPPPPPLTGSAPPAALLAAPARPGADFAPQWRLHLAYGRRLDEHDAGPLRGTGAVLVEAVAAPARSRGAVLRPARTGVQEVGEHRLSLTRQAANPRWSQTLTVAHATAARVDGAALAGAVPTGEVVSVVLSALLSGAFTSGTQRYSGRWAPTAAAFRVSAGAGAAVAAPARTPQFASDAAAAGSAAAVVLQPTTLFFPVSGPAGTGLLARASSEGWCAFALPRGLLLTLRHEAGLLLSRPVTATGPGGATHEWLSVSHRLSWPARQVRGWLYTGSPDGTWYSAASRCCAVVSAEVSKEINGRRCCAFANAGWMDRPAAGTGRWPKASIGVSVLNRVPAYVTDLFGAVTPLRQEFTVSWLLDPAGGLASRGQQQIGPLWKRGSHEFFEHCRYGITWKWGERQGKPMRIFFFKIKTSRRECLLLRGLSLPFVPCIHLTQFIQLPPFTFRSFTYTFLLLVPVALFRLLVPSLIADDAISALFILRLRPNKIYIYIQLIYLLPRGLPPLSIPALFLATTPAGGEGRADGAAAARPPLGGRRAAAAPSKALGDVAPFNHYTRHTRLKRCIFAWRQRALQLEADGQAKEKVSGPQALQAEAEYMALLYHRLDAAMQQQQFRRAHTLRQALIGRRHRLQRRLREAQVAHTEATVSEGSSMSSQAVAALPPSRPAAAPVYCSFHPDSRRLAGAFRNPLDRRRCTRHPLLLPVSAVEMAQQQCGMGGAGESSAAVEMAWEKALEAAAQQAEEALRRSNKLPRRPPHPIATNRHARNGITDALDDLAFTTLRALFEEQCVLRKKQPLQLKARQRYVVGFHEVIKWLKAGRLQIVLLAADLELELEQGEGGPAAAAPPPPPPPASKGQAPRRTAAAGAEAEQRADPAAGVRAPLCLTCLSRHAMAYALVCKGRCQVGCVGISTAEQHHFLLKALKSYGELLLDHGGAGQPPEGAPQQYVIVQRRTSISMVSLQQPEAELCRRLAPFRASLHLTQHRVARHVDAAVKAKPAAPAELRRLGALLQRATRLIHAIESSGPLPRGAAAPGASPSPGASPVPRAPADECGGGAGDDGRGDAGALYEGQLAEVFDVLLRDVVRGYAFLDAELRRLGVAAASSDEVPLLPLTAVGSLGVMYDGGVREGPPQPVLLTHPCRDAALSRDVPVPALLAEVRANCFIPGADPKLDGAVRRSAPPPAPAGRHQGAPSGATDLEAEALTDVRTLVAQMREHAEQMREWVGGVDKAALHQNEALLSRGVQMTAENLKELSQLPGGGGESRHPAPALLRRLPYGSLLWTQLLLPIWEVLQQVLLVLVVLSATAFALGLIFMRPKPATRVVYVQRPAAQPSVSLSSIDLTPSPPPITELPSAAPHTFAVPLSAAESPTLVQTDAGGPLFSAAAVCEWRVIRKEGRKEGMPLRRDKENEHSY
eukprot:gene9448-6631_t